MSDRLLDHVRAKVVARRKELGLSTYGVNTLMGVTSGYLRDFERRKKGASLFMVARIAMVLDLRMTDLLPTTAQLGRWADEAEEQTKLTMQEQRKAALAGLNCLKAWGKEIREYGAVGQAKA